MTLKLDTDYNVIYLVCGFVKQETPVEIIIRNTHEFIRFYNAMIMSDYYSDPVVCVPYRGKAKEVYDNIVKSRNLSNKSKKKRLHAK